MPAWNDGLFTLVAVVVGAAASYLATTFAERRRWRQQQSTRWDASRLAAYAAYADAVSESMMIATRVGAFLNLGARQQPLDPTIGLPELARSEAERGRRWQTVQLLGDPDTVAAGRLWHQAVWQLEWFARGLKPGESWEDAFALASRR